MDRTIPDPDGQPLTESGIGFPDGAVDGLALPDAWVPGDGPLHDQLVPPDLTPPCSTNPEQLDGKDNNCDNQVDEGFWANAQTVSYQTLNQQHSGCGASTSFSDVCTAAANRHCKAQGYMGGYGPVEYGASDGVIVCLADAFYTTVTYSDLTAQHSSCTPATAFSLWCNSAIHRVCGVKGYVSGVGPVEHSASVADVICVQHAKVYQVSFATLASHHASCTAQDAFVPPCQAAINRFCQSKGHATGFGPVEQNVDAWVTCVDDQ